MIKYSHVASSLVSSDDTHIFKSCILNATNTSSFIVTSTNIFHFYFYVSSDCRLKFLGLLLKWKIWLKVYEILVDYSHEVFG